MKTAYSTYKDLFITNNFSLFISFDRFVYAFLEEKQRDSLLRLFAPGHTTEKKAAAQNFVKEKELGTRRGPKG